MGLGTFRLSFCILVASWAGSTLALILGANATHILVGLLAVTAGGLLVAAREQCHAGTVTSQTATAVVTAQLEERYAQASFLAKVSHELRTPLHNILGLLRIVYMNDRNATNKYYLRLIQEASTNLLTTINDVLDYSKADTGMLSVTLAQTRLDSVVREALRTVAPRAFDKANLELLCSWDDSVPRHVTTDGTRLRQILINLLGNAIKFTAEGTVHLHVQADPAGDGRYMLRFTVTDTGAGIPQGKLTSIFEPFNQVDMTVVRRAQGTGLGLTIVKQLVSVLHGEVGVTSVLKEGSTFWFTIPVKSAQPEVPQAQLSIDWTQKHIFLLSKGEHLTKLLSSTLSSRGAKVSVADAPVTPDQLKEWSIDYIVAVDAALTTEASLQMLSIFAAERGAATVVTLLSPASLRLREQCTKMKLPNLLPLPVVSQDVLDSLAGTYVAETQDDCGFERLTSRAQLNILIADDVPTNQLILRSALEEAGHRVSAVSDGEELLTAIRRQIEAPESVAKADLFDVVLTDVQMPKMDGITVIKHTRDLEHTHGGHPIPMIAVTAHAFDTERNRIFAAGANGILTKPLDPKDLERQLGDIERRSVPTVTDGSATTVSAVSPGAQVAGVAAPDAESPFVAAVEHILLAQRAEERGPGIDIRDVFSRSGESPRRTLLMMRSFVSCYADILAGLNYVEGTSTAEELGKSAHALKGLLAEAGVKETRAQAYDVEKLGKEGKLAEIIPLLPALVTSTEQVAAVVATIVGSFDKNGVLLAAQEGGASAPA